MDEQTEDMVPGVQDLVARATELRSRIAEEIAELEAVLSDLTVAAAVAEAVA